MAKGSFGVEKVSAPSKNPMKCPIICFAPDKKKLISRTFKIRGTLVFSVPKRERASEQEREIESESDSGSGKGKGKG
jgi:hypothetical protein